MLCIAAANIIARAASNPASLPGCIFAGAGTGAGALAVDVDALATDVGVADVVAMEATGAAKRTVFLRRRFFGIAAVVVVADVVAVDIGLVVVATLGADASCCCRGGDVIIRCRSCCHAAVSAPGADCRVALFSSRKRRLNSANFASCSGECGQPGALAVTLGRFASPDTSNDSAGSPAEAAVETVALVKVCAARRLLARVTLVDTTPADDAVTVTVPADADADAVLVTTDDVDGPVEGTLAADTAVISFCVRAFLRIFTAAAIEGTCM